MATSEVGIINYALSKMGEDPIIARSDDLKAARVADLRYDPVRAALLRAHPWNFATRRAQLAKLAASPDFGYDNQFQLPDDYLRLLRFSGYNDRQIDHAYRIEGRRVLTNESTLKLVYIADITDPNEFDNLFIEAFAFALAADICMPITQNDQLTDMLDKKAQVALQDARTVDAQEEPPKELTAEAWLDARFGGSDAYRAIDV